jgi:hypothetical protein
MRSLIGLFTAIYAMNTLQEYGLKRLFARR